MSCFEKTKPICDGMKYRNVFSERKLWQYLGLGSRKKQSQFIAKQSQYADILSL
jgi:hypothetical protein